ncbi:MAG: hypothetical protein QOI96_796 [Verrucomicrobiota bacterium]
MTRGRAGEQRADRLDGLTIAANHATDVALAKLDLENRRASVRNFREHHFVGIFDELANNEIEKFFHLA